MTTQDYLDLLMAHFDVRTIYALAKRLGLSEVTVRNWSKGHTIGPDHALLIADTLGIDPTLILADMAAESAKSDRVRSTWAALADSLRSHAPAIAAALVGASITAAHGIDASGMYIM